MSEIAQRMYEHFKTGKPYFFSKDNPIKINEMFAVRELEDNGYITIKIETISVMLLPKFPNNLP